MLLATTGNAKILYGNHVDYVTGFGATVSFRVHPRVQIAIFSVKPSTSRPLICEKTIASPLVSPSRAFVSGAFSYTVGVDVRTEHTWYAPQSDVHRA